MALIGGYNYLQSDRQFDQSKIQKFKEAFDTMIDRNCGSFIGKGAMNDTLSSLGKSSVDGYL
ncbi:hypothetical protein ACRRTK_021934 [Alexandromys fortis]